MAREALRFVRGTAGQVAAYTGPAGEPVYNSDAGAIHIQDGATAGGVRLARKDEVDTGLASKAAASHTHDDRYYTETEADGRFVRIADHNGALTTGGTSTAYTLALATSPASLADGLSFSFTCDETNTGASTLVVTPSGGSAFASKKLRKFVGSAEVGLVAGDIGAGGRYMVQYEASADGGAGAYILLNPAYPRAIARIVPTSAVATADFTWPSGVMGLRLSGLVLGDTLGTILGLRASFDNGSTYKSGASDYRAAFLFQTSTTVLATGIEDSTSATVTHSTDSANIIRHVNGLIAQGGGSNYPQIQTVANGNNANGNTNGLFTTTVLTLGTITNIRLLCSAGNIAVGTQILVEAL